MGFSALQVTVDHLHALNATLVELRERQQRLEPAMREHRDRLLALLQEPGCQGDCEGTLNRTRTLELAADFVQVWAQGRGHVGLWWAAPSAAQSPSSGCPLEGQGLRPW